MVRAFNGWVPPDSGTDQDASHFGGGVTDYDAEYAAQAAAFLRAASAKSSKPFALVVALANPHDIMGFPSTWDAKSLSDVAPYKGSSNYGDDTPGCVEQGIDLPSTVDEETARNHKPGAQARSVVMWAEGLGPFATLAGVPSRGKWTLKGADLMPVVNDAIAHPTHLTAVAQDSVIFTTDEVVGEKTVGQPSHIRCLVEADMKIAMWFDPAGLRPSEWELYDLGADPEELRNMADPTSPWFDARRTARMKAKLERRMEETGRTPTVARR